MLKSRAWYFHITDPKDYEFQYMNKKYMIWLVSYVKLLEVRVIQGYVLFDKQMEHGDVKALFSISDNVNITKCMSTYLEATTYIKNLNKTSKTISILEGPYELDDGNLNDNKE